jgi:hypothetical protein
LALPNLASTQHSDERQHADGLWQRVEDLAWIEEKGDTTPNVTIAPAAAAGEAGPHAVANAVTYGITWSAAITSSMAS